MSHARIFGKITLFQGVLLVSALALALTLAGLLAAGGIAQGADPAAPSGSAGTITVTKTEDTDATCTATDCSLREAIKAAVSGDTVAVPAGTYTLTLGSELAVNTGGLTNTLAITGAGAGDTIIQGATSSGDATSRVFNITGGTVAISGVTIRHGTVAGNGGGIFSMGNLILTDSAVRSWPGRRKNWRK